MRHIELDIDDPEKPPLGPRLLRGGLKMRHLAITIAIARCGSVVRAAEVLNTSQPAISRSLAEIEQIVGGRLFERRARETVPTGLGSGLVRHAEEIFGSLERADLELEHIKRGGTARLAVGCNLSASMSLVPHAVILLRQRLPGIHVAVRESSLETLLPDLRARKLDVIVARAERSTRSTDLREIALPDEPLVLVAAPDHPLTTKPKVRWKDLESVAWIIPPPGTPVREGLELIFQREGIEPRQTDVESVSSLANIHFMRELGAVTVIPLALAQRLSQGGLAARIPIALPPVFRPLAAITLRAVEHNPALEGFLACLRQVPTAPAEGSGP